jgi:glycosyltransferase involved in cell wall biosynthesis
VERVSWLPPKPIKARFIPIGANVPALMAARNSARSGCEARTIAVFGITGGGLVGNEVVDIAYAAKAATARIARIRLVTLGRGSLESEPKFREVLRGSPVDYEALGILPAEEIARVLSAADVSLFVRGPISTRRGSAIASIACGVPLVAYANGCLPKPLAEAGVVGVRRGDREALAEATIKVLSDRNLWLGLHCRNQRAQHEYFNWEAVAGRFLEFLDHA